MYSCCSSLGDVFIQSFASPMCSATLLLLKYVPCLPMVWEENLSAEQTSPQEKHWTDRRTPTIGFRDRSVIWDKDSTSIHSWILNPMRLPCYIVSQIVDSMVTIESHPLSLSISKSNLQHRGRFGFIHDRWATNIRIRLGIKLALQLFSYLYKEHVRTWR